MPRRPSKKVGLKKARGVDKRDASMKRWNTADDIPMDEEDQFQSSRDKILLEGGERGGSDDGEDDEVFALEGLGGGDSDDDDDEMGYEDVEDDEEDEEPVARAPKSKSKKGKKASAQADLPPNSDEEAEEEEEEEEEGWGRKKSAYYSSNADLIDSDDEEANELEEQEAIRLQLKARAALSEDDFGLSELTLEQGDVQDEDLDFTEQPLANALPAEKDALLRHIEKTSPESLALARDWEGIASSIAKSQAKLERQTEQSTNLESEKLGLGMVHLHQQTLLAYASTLAFYLYLRASPKYCQRPELLRDHDVLKRLLVLKQSLATLEDLDFAMSDSDDNDEDDDDVDAEEEDDLNDLDDSSLELDDDDELMDLVDSSGVDMADLTPAEREMLLNAIAHKMAKKNKSKKEKGLGLGLDADELEDLLQDQDVGDDIMDDDFNFDSPEEAPVKPKKKTKKAKGLMVDDLQGLDDLTTKPKKKKKSKDSKSATPVFDLIEPEISASSSSSRATKPPRPSVNASAPDAFGELSSLSSVDAQDKKARKKSLQFYTARVEKAGARREGARNAAGGGDDDIPYRVKERRQDLNSREKGKAPIRGQGGEDLDDADGESAATGLPKGTKRVRENDDEDGDDAADDENGYYSLVKKQSTERKEKKKAEYESGRAAERADIHDATSGGGDGGPRTITRAILKNRGLTPHRAKSVRNPRVKKRMKFDQAQKKIASQRPTFKAGVDASRYAGERTGISKVVKSTRL